MAYNNLRNDYVNDYNSCLDSKNNSLYQFKHSVLDENGNSYLNYN